MLVFVPTRIYDDFPKFLEAIAQSGEKMTMGRWGCSPGRLDIREVLARSYSTSSYFSNLADKFTLTYDIERIDEGFSVGKKML